MVVKKNEKTDLERAYYASKDVSFEKIIIDGPLDGESAFKECKNISVTKSELYLRYPFWHNTDLKVNSSVLFDTCRAPIWYSKNVEFKDVKITGVKAFRECRNVKINRCEFDSEEIFWNCSKIEINNSKINSVYAFMGCRDAKLKNMTFAGKYSFQYTKNFEISNCNLDTKDAFWHSENVVVRDSIIKGEYLGWYSKNLTLINCTITGTQPLCYAKNLTLVDCTMEGCDLSFEYSEVSGTILKKVKSIKNPLKGRLTVEKLEEVIIDENDRSHGKFSLNILSKKV